MVRLLIAALVLVLLVAAPPILVAAVCADCGADGPGQSGPCLDCWCSCCVASTGAFGPTASLKPPQAGAAELMTLVSAAASIDGPGILHVPKLRHR